VNLGDVLVGVTSGTQTSSLSSPGAFNQNTTLTVATGTTSSGGVSVGSGSTQIFNGTNTTGALKVSGSFATSGTKSSSISVTTTGEGLGGETDAPVNIAYTANVFQAFSGSTPSSTSGSGSAALTLTNLASTDSGQRAGVTITGFNTGNANFVVGGAGSVGTANGSNVTATVGTVSIATQRLNGNYSYAGTITGTAQYTDVALQGTGVVNQTWNSVTVNATVTGNASNSRSNVFSAQIMSGSSYAGYSLSSSVLVSGTSQHPNTGSGGTTQATILAGVASGLTTVSMSFDSTPSQGFDDSFRTSDILTLTGINPTGSNARPDVTLTDVYVLQMSFDTSATGIEYIAQNTGNGWINAVGYNSNNYGNIPSQLGNNPFMGSYALYLSTPTGSGGGEGLTLQQQLGAYGYSGGLAWAVLDHTSVLDPVSEFAVIPEPGTYALIFSGFGMLLAFRRLRRRSLHGKM